MKRLFYAVFTLMVCGATLSCTREIITDDEKLKSKNDSISRRIDYKFEVDGDEIPDSTGLQDLSEVIVLDSVSSLTNKIHYRSEIDPDEIPDTGGLFQD